MKKGCLSVFFCIQTVGTLYSCSVDIAVSNSYIFLSPFTSCANLYLRCKVLIGCLMPVSEVACSWISLHLLRHNEPKLWLEGFVSMLWSGKDSKPVSVRLSRRYHTWMQWILRACSTLTLMTSRFCWTFELITVTMTTRVLFLFSLEAQIFVLGHLFILTCLSTL